MTDSPSQSESGGKASDEPAKEFSLWRSALVMVLAVGLTMIIVNLALRQFGWAAQLDYSNYSALISGGAAIVALVPVWVLSWKSVQGAALGFLAGMLVRMGLCGAAVMIGGGMEGVDHSAWSMWIAGWYVLVLTVEVAIVGRYVARSPFVPAVRPAGVVRSDTNLECRVTP